MKLILLVVAVCLASLLDANPLPSYTAHELKLRDVAHGAAKNVKNLIARELNRFANAKLHMRDASSSVKVELHKKNSDDIGIQHERALEIMKKWNLFREKKDSDSVQPGKRETKAVRDLVDNMKKKLDQKREVEMKINNMVKKAVLSIKRSISESQGDSSGKTVRDVINSMKKKYTAKREAELKLMKVRDVVKKAIQAVKKTELEAHVERSLKSRRDAVNSLKRFNEAKRETGMKLKTIAKKAAASTKILEAKLQKARSVKLARDVINTVKRNSNVKREVETKVKDIVKKAVGSLKKGTLLEKVKRFIPGLGDPYQNNGGSTHGGLWDDEPWKRQFPGNEPWLQKKNLKRQLPWETKKRQLPWETKKRQLPWENKKRQLPWETKRQLPWMMQPTGSEDKRSALVRKAVAEVANSLMKRSRRMGSIGVQHGSFHPAGTAYRRHTDCKDGDVKRHDC